MTSCTNPLNISQEDLSELRHLSSLLHLFHHRNQNQHRRSVWYRHFSILRKQLDQFNADQAKLVSVPTTNLARAKKKIQDAEVIAITQKRLEFWRDVMVAKWQHAFSQLVADGRFSVLGLVLTAVLSQVCGIVGITAELEELGQAEVERVLEEFGREEWGATGEDVGEVVRREEAVSATVNSITEIAAEAKVKPTSTSQDLSKPMKRKPEPVKSQTKKKRKKTGNAIDDIFG